jgi:glycyl-tRNA synthetase
MAEEGKSPEQLQDDMDMLNAKITKQGSHVRQMKKDGAADGIGEAVTLLQNLKLEASQLQDKLQSGKESFNRKSFDDLILRKMFVVPSFEIHGGVKGLYDLGPSSCALKVSVRRREALQRV